jgi:uncharacterized delta-60 repeat protein
MIWLMRTCGLVDGSRVEPRRILAAACLGIGVAFACAIGVASSPAASSSVTVSLTLASATSLTTAGCPTMTAGVTDFGSVLPGSSATTSADCTVTFGSSNDTASLRLLQSDAEGGALWGGQATGALHPTFAGGAGWRTASFIPTSHETIFAMALQRDMRVVTVGREWFGGQQDLSISRFNADGTTDTTFGTSGNVRVDVGTVDIAKAVAIEPDGHILVAAKTNATVDVTSIVRLTSSGAIDTSWGTGGRVDLDLRAASAEEPRAMVLLGDGSIMLAGSVGGANDDGYVAKVLPSGGLDTSYGVSGIRTFDVSGLDDEVEAMRIQPDGKVVLGGFTREPIYNRDDMLAVRLTTGGALDTTFSGDGIATLDYSASGDHWDKAWGVALQADGRIVLAGASQPTFTNDAAMFARLLPNGTLDTTFGTNGRTISDPTGVDDDALTVDVLPDGSIAAAGGMIVAPTPTMQAWRLTSTGALDTNFSGDGVAPVTIPGASQALPYAQVVHADGSILLGGEANMAAGDEDLLLTRFAATPIPDYAAGRWGSASPSFGACLRDSTNTTPTWTLDPNNSCTIDDADPWKPIARVSADPTAEVARTGSGVLNGTVKLRFGVLLASTQRPGGLIAPLTFEVVAPA